MRCVQPRMTRHRTVRTERMSHPTGTNRFSMVDGRVAERQLRAPAD